MIFNKIFVIFGKTFNTMPGPGPKKYSYIDSQTGRTVIMKAKQTLPSGKTVYTESFEKPKRNYVKAQGGVQASGLKSNKTTTGAVVGNQRRKAKSIMAEKLQRQNKCTPNSKSKNCGPGR